MLRDSDRVLYDSDVTPPYPPKVKFHFVIVHKQGGHDGLNISTLLCPSLFRNPSRFRNPHRPVGLYGRRTYGPNHVGRLGRVSLSRDFVSCWVSGSEDDGSLGVVKPLGLTRCVNFLVWRPVFHNSYVGKAFLISLSFRETTRRLRIKDVKCSHTSNCISSV